MELARFIFESAWHFAGFLLLIAVIGAFVEGIIEHIFRR